MLLSSDAAKAKVAKAKVRMRKRKFRIRFRKILKCETYECESESDIKYILFNFFCSLNFLFRILFKFYRLEMEEIAFTSSSYAPHSSYDLSKEQDDLKPYLI
jgi:hypothetical protein